ncbi:O-antigen ligase family protein [Alicyclobacillus suci]|uniref:O-antigen ligase family protein n=1 Tax=Alicyclobacillus suci TaxID=2816080 RepID=UPI001A90B1F9|nr:O-antigen ligase family protein [Alicyclobacillus suci]
MSLQRLRYARTSIGAIIAIGLVFLPFLSNGVFFQQGRFILDIVLLAILVVGSATIVFRRTIREHLLAGEGLRYGDLAIGLLVFLYLIALFYAASVNLAVNGAIDALALLVPYLAFRFTSVRQAIAGWAGIGFSISSVVIDVLGLANGWGQLRYPSATEMSPQHQVEIASVFQYHNAYAAFAASVATGLFVWSARSSVKWVWHMLAMGIAGINVLSLLASGSRGALAIWALIIVLALFGMKEPKNTPFTLRSRFLGDIYLGLIGGIVGYVLVHRAITKLSPDTGWLGVTLSLVVPMALVAIRSLLLANRNILQGGGEFWSLVGIGVVLTLVCGVAKSHSILAKLQSYQVHQLSVSQRFIFWRDGLKIFTRNPITGSGAGAWQAMYQKVQSYPYISARAHSFGIDTLIETGIIGLICMIMLAWPMLKNTTWPPLRQIADNKDYALRFALISGGLVLLAHSLMDWDMSFEYLQVFLYASFGAASGLTPILKRRSQRYRGSVYTSASMIVTGVLGAIGLVVSVCAIFASSIAAKGATLSGQQAAKTFINAYHLAPYNDTYLEQAASALLNQANPSKQQKQWSESLIRSAEQLNPYSPSLAANYAQLAYSLGSIGFAQQQALLAFRNAPFNPNNASLAINALMVDGLNNASSNPEKAKTLFQGVQSLYNEVQKNKEIVARLPSYLPPSWTYTLQPFSIVSVAATDYILGDTQEAIKLASGQIKSTDPHTSEVAHMIVLMGQTGASSKLVQQFVGKHSSIRSSYRLVLNAIQAGQK